MVAINRFRNDHQRPDGGPDPGSPGQPGFFTTGGFLKVRARQHAAGPAVQDDRHRPGILPGLSRVIRHCPADDGVAPGTRPGGQAAIRYEPGPEKPDGK